MRKLVPALVAASVFGAATVPPVAAQQERAAAPRVFVRGDSVFIYHGARPSARTGVNIYRRAAGSTEWVRLTAEPLKAVEDPARLREYLGPDMEAVRAALGGRDAQAVLVRLRIDRAAAAMLGRLYPGVARALGQLHIDTTAAPGTQVSYRVEVVDGAGRRVGEPQEATAFLTTLVPAPPDSVWVRHEETRVVVGWRYPRPRDGADDGVASFDVFRVLPGRSPEKLNAQPVLRVFNQDTFNVAYAAPAMGQQESLVVVARAVTGQPGTPSRAVSHTLVDRFPPSQVVGVRARAAGGRSVEVTWQPAVEPDVAGYHVYRGAEVEGEYVRLTTTPLGPSDLFFVDTTAVPGREQYYRVAAVDAAGNEGERSTGALALVVDRDAPAAPTAVTAEHRPDGTVRVSWQDPAPAPDLWTYVVLRRRADDPNTLAWLQVNAGELRERELIDRAGDVGFAEGATYRYGVAAVDSARNFSDTVFTVVRIPDRTPPGPPTDLSVRSDGMRVRLDWGPSPAGDVVAYLIHRSEVGGADTVLARVPASARSFRDERLRLGATYVYAVSAVDSLGNEGPRTAPATLAFRDATPPRSPRNARAQLVDGGVRISWERVPGDDVAGYRVYRATIQTGRFEPVTDGLVTETSVLDARGKAGLWYRVRAVDTSGNESQYSDPVQAVAPATARSR